MRLWTVLQLAYRMVLTEPINPTTTLRNEDIPGIRSSSLGRCVRCESSLHSGEIFRHKRRQIPIFSEMQKILFMKSIDFVIGIFLNEIWMDQIWFALRFATFECFDAIKRETTGKTGDTTEKTFERFRKSVRNIVFIDLKLACTGVNWGT